MENTSLWERRKVMVKRKMKTTLSHLLELHNIEKVELNENGKEVDVDESI